MKPTEQQVAFLQALTGTQRHLALVARAGCGKTSTILLGVDAIVQHDPAAEVMVCAFNKAIADEVSAKLKARGHTDWRRVQAGTLHSAGYGLVKFVFKPEINDHKVRDLVDAAAATGQIDAYLADEFKSQIIQLVRIAKQAGVGFFGDLPIGDNTVWYNLADHYDINGFNDTTELEPVVAAAQAVYKMSLAQTSVIDFDDMILFPLIKNLRVKFTKSHIFLDEAQDLSRARQALARKFLTPRTGRMIIVGDDRQAIYGFSGADAEAMPNMIKSLDAMVLPLSVTWRCPQAVVALAQRLVPDIAAAPTAQAGVVRQLSTIPVAELTAQDAILCRNTAPLIPLAYSLIRQGKPCKVEGRSIGDGLKKLATRWKIKTIATLLNKLADYQDREIQKAMAKDQENKAEEVADRCATLREICEACTQKGLKDVSDVVDFIDRLFEDGATGVTVLATYHRSKGREWPNVYLLEHAERCPSKAARQEWQKQQEDNLAYVAFTRAQQSLTFVQP